MTNPEQLIGQHVRLREGGVTAMARFDPGTDFVVDSWSPTGRFYRLKHDPRICHGCSCGAELSIFWVAPVWPSDFAADEEP